MNIGKHIKTLREERGWTLQTVASRANTSASTISDIERGDMNPSLSMLERVAAAFDLSLADFFGVVFNPLSPDEQRLIEAFRAGDMREVMRVTLESVKEL